MSLDDDIAAWAATVRLTDADADGIFRRIAATPVRAAAAAPRLAPSWWRDYNAGFAARMVASTRPGSTRPGSTRPGSRARRAA